MSWFDAGALANIAKSALKEAQKTIDKALDIKEDGENIVPLNSPIDTNVDDFFGTWGISQSSNVLEKKEEQGKGSTLWGSFTGSFFVDTTKDPSMESLDDSVDSGNEKDFSRSKLVVQHSEEERDDYKTFVSNSDSIDVITDNATSPESDAVTSYSSSAKPSESIEVIGDSFSPSIEVLSDSSRRQSQHTDEFVSPLDSPSVNEKSSESLEIIPDEQNEDSVAEDTMSYTSVSESTSVTVLDTSLTISKPQKMLKDTFNSEISDVSPDKSSNIGEAITRAPGRTMHLPLQQVSHNQILIDTQPQSVSKQELPKILETTNIIDIPQEDEIVRSSGSETQLDTSTEDGSISDKTIVETQDSLLETSSDTTSTTTETSSNSTNLKKMLADAMTEKSTEMKIADLSDKGSLDSIANSSQIEIVSRDFSPISSEKSDLVKIGSDHTSCHTSCDELETTTSSDIEIISSPNGDSSSTQSRQSPAKKALLKKSDEKDSLLHKVTTKKAKGHNRELSEASSISDDSHPNGEIDRLLKRISEMTEILESRESKLIEVNRRNAELQENNSDLKRQLDCVLTQQLESADLSQVTEEYTQRLSALEKKFQQAIREKDTLRKQLEQARLDVATRLSKNELESTVAEKDELIKELREEGEKLSKQQLQHSNIIKKLRAKEKELEQTIKNLKETNETITSETDHLKKSLTAKEDVERTQIEAVHNLTTKNKKQDSELAKLKSQLDDLTQKYDTTKKSLEAAKKELADKTKTSSELLHRQQMLESLENEKRMTQSQNEEVISQLDDLREQLQKLEEEQARKEQKMRLEKSELLRRLEEADNRNEELAQEVLEVSKPLVRQLESLQAALSSKVASFEKVEQELTLKISDLQSKFQASSSQERSTKEECIGLRSKLADLEGQLSTAKHEVETSKILLQQVKTERQISEQEMNRQMVLLNEKIASQTMDIDDKKREIDNLRQQLELEKNNSDKQETKTDSPTINDGSRSPTLSLGKVSVSDSLSSSFWQDDFEVGHTPRYTNMFEMQMLQSNLKQKEGELQQVQWEMNRREQERSLLNSEISTLINKVEELEKITKEHDKLKEQFVALQQQYDTLCQLYGEKVEENEELKLDLLDVKEMYKSQIDELLRQQREK